MEISKARLKQIILEELEEQAKVTASDYKKQQMKQATTMQSGVTDQERAILTQIENKLRQLASKGNLAAAGRVTRILQMLNKELDKALEK